MCSFMWHIISSTAADRRIEELEKELLKVHQQMLDHISDSQVIYDYKLLNIAAQWLAHLHFLVVKTAFSPHNADSPNFDIICAFP